MGKFNLSKNGYDKKEVDDYLFELTNDYESKLQEQKLRITEQKKELAKAEEELFGIKFDF